jgi:hypothetical protein
LIISESKEDYGETKNVYCAGPYASLSFRLLVAGLGAYGGYKWKEGGYTVQSPVGKDRQDKEEE